MLYEVVQKLKITKNMKMFLIINVVYLVSVGGYFIFFNEPSYGEQVIEQYSSSNIEYSELYQVENKRLVNVTGENFIHPNDALEYRFTIVNPLEHQIRVTYEFEVFSERVKIHEQYGEWNIQGGDDEQGKFEFFLFEEGPYDLKINLIFYNEHSGEKYAQYTSWNKDVKVLSFTNKLQDDSNQLTFQGLITASVVGVGGVVALITSITYSKSKTDKIDKQNKNLKEQVNF